jgi:hypothetical protein
MIESAGTLRENCWSQKLHSRSFSYINLRNLRDRQSRVWEDEDSWKDYLYMCYYNIRALAAIVDCSSFEGTYLAIIAIEAPRFFDPKLALTQKCDYSLLEEEKSGACLRASHAIAQLYTFMIVGLLQSSGLVHF